MKKLSLLAIVPSLIFTSPIFPANAQNSDVINYQVIATKLDVSRNNLSPTTGGSAYSFSQRDIANLPRGAVTSLNQILLQAPGVTQDSYGQFHIRGDHSNVQYRINGIMIPEGIGGFGQILDSHFVDKMTLLTGALPAQYGYRTAGVVDIKTKSGALKPGGRSEFTVGGYDTIGGNQEFSGSAGKLNYYLNASYLQNNLGIELPTPGRQSIHNFTRQDKQFGHFSYLIDAQKRLSVMIANATNRFEIPNNPGQQPAFNLNGVNNFSSSNLDERQNEYNRFAIIALQGTLDNGDDYQLSAFTRYSNVVFKPDYNGDLIFNGVASNINNKSQSTGLQGDFSRKLNDKNILRYGLFLSSDVTKSDKNTALFAVASDGTQEAEPFSIATNSKKRSGLYGVYLQNEWQALEKLTLNYGARFDASQAYVNASQLSPRLGAVYQFSKRTKFHAGYARYFTPPATELLTTQTLAQFEGTTNAPNNLINDKVKPERSNYYDIGVTHKLTENLNIGLDGYYKQVRDLLDRGQFGQALIYTPFNYQKGRIYGLELTSDYRRDNFSAYLNFSAQKAKAKNITSGQYLFDAEELSHISGNYVHLDHDQSYNASAGLAYLFYNTNYSINGIYGSGLRRDFANSRKLPSYTQVNLGAARDFTMPVINKFNARFSVVNLFDESYIIRDGSGIGVGAPQYGQRRTYYLTMSKNF